jgi:hypothetical protein
MCLRATLCFLLLNAMLAGVSAFRSSLLFYFPSPNSLCKRSTSFRQNRPLKSYSQRNIVAQMENLSQETVDLLQITSKGIEGSYDAQELSRIQQLIQILEERGREKLYLSDPTINDYYRVKYVIEGKGPNAGTPVGGGFRYGIGRAFFRTEDTFQHIIDGEAVNMLYFTLLGCIKGCVTLRGDIEPMTYAERQSLMLRYCFVKHWTRATLPSI